MVASGSRERRSTGEEVEKALGAIASKIILPRVFRTRGRESENQMRNPISEKSRKQNKKKFIRCLLDVRKIPLEKFRLPRDGKKRLRAARSRYNFLCALAGDANADGTFQRFDRKAGKINFSPRVKKLLQHMAERTIYRMTTDLRELGFLSWRREKKHYGSRIFQIHVSPRQQVADSEKKHLPDTAGKQEKHLPTRHVLLPKTPAYKAGDNTCQITSETQQATGVNPVKKVPYPPLESFPPIGSPTFVGRAAAGVSINTPPKNTAATARAFLAFGFDAPFGHTRFQNVVIRSAGEIGNGNLVDVMERVIVQLNGKVPRPWYDKKHALEEKLRSAEMRSETQVGSPIPFDQTDAYFSKKNINAHCDKTVAALERAAEKHPEIASRLRKIAQIFKDRVTAACVAESFDLENLEREIGELEESLFILLQKHASDELKSQTRQDVDRDLKKSRSRLGSKEITRLQNKSLHKKLLKAFELPAGLGLYYMGTG